MSQSENEEYSIETEEVRAWPSISSAFMKLLSGSRSNQDNTEWKKDSDSINEELTCPICKDFMKEAHSTNCGHSFCYHCITQHMEQQPDCPLCRSPLLKTDIHPNFQLNKLAEHYLRIIKEEQRLQRDPVERLLKATKGDHASIATALAASLSYDDLASLLEAAINQKRKTQKDQAKEKDDLLKCFLTRLKEKNQAAVAELLAQNQHVASDLKVFSNQDEQQVDSSSIVQRKRSYSEISLLSGSENKDDFPNITRRTLSQQQEYAPNSYASRLEPRFDDLRTMYYASLSYAEHNVNKRRKLLQEFSSTMYQLTKFSYVSVFESINSIDNTAGSSIISSTEFDRDEEYFAIGGVTKEIKIYDFSLMGDKNVTTHCPVRVMDNDHKISCLSWSPYIKSQVASSNYEGFVDLWDVVTGQRTYRFEEHSKRAWSVDICRSNPSLLASGSDDTTVKIWSLSSNKSTHTLQQKGNVCCAQFAPDNGYLLAVSSADHNVSCYDLRNPDIPVNVYQGHRKAVSYVKWMNDNELVSASTDGKLKLWDRESSNCTKTFSGHRNEKNFVGLSVNNDWISCGSETNAVFIYHKTSSKPFMKYKFSDRSNTENDTEENDDESVEKDATRFVSSVCWKKNSNILLAANSQGTVKVLELK